MLSPIMQVKCPTDYMTGRVTVNIAIKQLGGCIVLAYSVIIIIIILFSYITENTFTGSTYRT